MGLRTGRGRTVGALVTACLLLLSGSASAVTTWEEPETLLDDSEPIQGLAIEIGPAGYAVAAWVQGQTQIGPHVAGSQPPQVWAGVKSEGEDAFGEPEPISAPGGRSMQLAVAPDGQTVIVWRSALGAVKAAFRDPDSGWSEPQTVAPAPAGSPSLAIGPGGTAVAAWVSGRYGTNVTAAVRPPDGEFGDPEVIARDPGIGNYVPVVAVGGGGRGVVAWEGRCPIAEPQLRRKTRAVFLRTVGGEPYWERRTVIDNSKCPSSQLDVAMSDDGRAVLTISGHLREWNGVRAAVRPPGGSFRRAQLISRWGEQANFAQVGMDKDGGAIVGWPIYGPVGHVNGTLVSTRAADGSFSDPERVGGENTSLEDLDVGRRGHAIFVWHGLASARIRAMYMEPGEWFGEAESVSPPLTDQALALPEVTISRTGEAMAAWGHPESSSYADGVFVAERDAPLIGPLGSN